jgi:hypothetical protein
MFDAPAVQKGMLKTLLYRIPIVGGDDRLSR